MSAGNAKANARAVFLVDPTGGVYSGARPVYTVDPETGEYVAGSSGGASDALNSATTVVDVSAATAPTSGQVLTATGSTAATWQTPSGGGSPQTSVRIVEEFIGGGSTTNIIGANGWSFLSGTVAAVASEANHPGILQRTTSATNNTNTTIYLSNQGSFNVILPSETFDLTFVVRLNTNDANTLVRVGALNSTANPGTSGIYFEKLAADTNWFRVTRTASVETRSDTGIAVSTGWVKLRIRRVDASTIGFTIDANSEQTATTNIPTATQTPGVQLVNSAAANKTIDLDYMQLDVAVTR